MFHIRGAVLDRIGSGPPVHRIPADQRHRARGSRTITVGLPPPDARISLSPLGFVADLGSAVPSRDIPRFVSLWQSGRLPGEALVSSTIRLDGINEATDHLAEGTAVRQLIRFDNLHHF